jgi:hypothetical protein
LSAPLLAIVHTPAEFQYAMRRPSGDHAGSRASLASCAFAVPSERITHTDPARSNAMR